MTGSERALALLVAELVAERDLLSANLEATQRRCSELLEEVRALRRASTPPPAPDSALHCEAP